MTVDDITYELAYGFDITEISLNDKGMFYVNNLINKQVFEYQKYLFLVHKQQELD